MNDTFSAGVAPGGLRDMQEIKILICYIFDKINKPLKKSDVIEILQNYGLANYFDISQAFAQMVRNGNISVCEEDDNYYISTSRGKMISNELNSSLPFTVKEKALKGINLYLQRQKNERENAVVIKKTDFGYNVCCNVSGGDFNMLEMIVYAPDMSTASIIKNNFYRKIDEVYKTMLSMLTQEE